MKKSIKNILYIALGIIALIIIVPRLFTIVDQCSFAVRDTYEKTINGIDYKIEIGNNPHGGGWGASNSYNSDDKSFTILMQGSGNNPTCDLAPLSGTYISYVTIKNIDLKDSGNKVVLITEGAMSQYSYRMYDSSTAGLILGIGDGNKIIETTLYEVHPLFKAESSTNAQIPAIVLERLDETHYMINGHVLDLSELDKSKDWTIRLKLYNSKSGSFPSNSEIRITYSGSIGLNPIQKDSWSSLPFVPQPQQQANVSQSAINNNVDNSYISAIMLVLVVVVVVLFFWVFRKKR